MKLKLSNPLSLSTALALATIGLGSFSSAAQAAVFNFSYTLQSGDVLSGMLYGDVQPDGDTVIVNFVPIMTQFNGVAGPNLAFIGSFTSVFGSPQQPGTVSFSGTVMDFAARESSTSGDIIAFDTNDPFALGTPSYFGSDSFGSISEPYNSANWSLTAKPVPEPLTMLGAGTAVAFGAGFKRRLAKKENKK